MYFGWCICHDLDAVELVLCMATTARVVFSLVLFRHFARFVACAPRTLMFCRCGVFANCLVLVLFMLVTVSMFPPAIDVALFPCDPLFPFCVFVRKVN